LHISHICDSGYSLKLLTVLNFSHRAVRIFVQPATRRDKVEIISTLPLSVHVCPGIGWHLLTLQKQSPQRMITLF